MITTAKLEKPRIPLDIFKKMVDTLDASELSELPPEKLPLHIPQEILDNAPFEKQSALEDLLFAAEAHLMNERMEIEEGFGTDVAVAVDISRQGGSATMNKMFKGRIQQLNELYDKWEQDHSKDIHKKLISGVSKLDDLVPHVREDSAKIAKGCNVLQELKEGKDKFDIVFVEAREHLVKQLQKIDECLGEYFVVRLIVMGVELQRTAERVSNMDQNANGLRNDIASIQGRLDNFAKVHRLSEAEMAKNPEVQKMHDDLQQLRQQEQSTDVLISEKDLIDWLDVIVDASLSPVGQAKIMGKTKDVRMALFQLLVRYCKSQEDAAKQVADNPFNQQDPEQVIKFMLKSEKFVLDYFANKRKNLTEWLGDAARKKMDTLDDLQDTMLSTVREKMQK